MLSSRALALLRKSGSLGKFCKTPVTPMMKQIRQSSHWYYRTDAITENKYNYMADAMGGFMWFWILYHVYHDYHHLIGESDYPDPSKWTDAELGIPPDEQAYENFDPEKCIVPLGFYDTK